MTGPSLILAALINPALFGAGVAAVALPVIIHLLARRRYRRIRWAAMDFLLDAEKRNRRRMRLEELILLALRCLAMLLIGLVLARPFVQPSGVAAMLGGRDRTERIFLLDDSFSMGYTSDGETSFARAKTSLVNLLNRLREHAPDDTVTLLRTSRPDDPVVTSAALDDQQTDRLMAQIEALTPSEQSLSVDACLQGVAKAAEAAGGVASAALYVLSDFQRVDWVEGGSPSPDGASSDMSRAASGGLAEPLRQWAGEQRAIRVILVDVGDDDAQNFAVTDLQTSQRQLVAGVDAAMEARVANYTRGTASDLELQVMIGQSARASAPVPDVPPGGIAAAGLLGFFPHAGDEVVRVELPPDNLPLDNSRSLALEVSDAIHILVVNGEPSSDPYLDEVHLLTTALRPAGDVFSGNRVDVVDEAALEGLAFEKYHLVVLCNLYRVSEPVADALHRYVFAGGGLAVFLGDQVSDPLVYNAALYRDGAGLLPAELQTVVSEGVPGTTLAGSDFLHPVVRVFSGQDNPFLERVHFQQFYGLLPAAAQEAVEAGPNTPARPFRPAATVLAHFNTSEPRPAMVERPYGRGRVMLFASAADMEWNDWARDPSYVVAMLEVVQHLAKTSTANRAVKVGEPLTLELDPAEYQPAALVRGPGYPQQQEEEITALPTDTGRLALTWPHTTRSGVYSIVLRPRTGGEELRRFAVNLEERESDLTPAGEDELRESFKGLPVDYIAGPAAAEDPADEGRRELWPLILALLMATLLVEQFLAYRFGRR